jgi:hypothetical protein
VQGRTAIRDEGAGELRVAQKRSVSVRTKALIARPSNWYAP